MTISNEDLVLDLVACDASYKPAASFASGESLAPYPDSGLPAAPNGGLPEHLNLAEFDEWKYQTAFEDDTTGFGVVVFKHQTRNEYRVAFRGTDGPSTRDWKENLGLGMRQWMSVQPGGGQDFLNNFLLELPSVGGEAPKIYFTGQSLGGALAQYAAHDYLLAANSLGLQVQPSQVTLTTFNGLGAVEGLLHRAELNLGTYDPTALREVVTAHYYFNGDIVSRLGGGHLNDSQMYEIEIYRDDNNRLSLTKSDENYPLDPISAHRIESAFYRAFEATGGNFAIANPEPQKPQYLTYGGISVKADYIASLFLDPKLGSDERSAALRLTAGILVALREGSKEDVEGLARPLIQAIYESRFSLSGDPNKPLLSKANYEYLVGRGLEFIKSQLETSPDTIRAIATRTVLTAMVLDGLRSPANPLPTEEDLQELRELAPDDSFGSEVPTSFYAQHSPLERALSLQMASNLINIDLIDPTNATDLKLLRELGLGEQADQLIATTFAGDDYASGASAFIIHSARNVFNDPTKEIGAGIEFLKSLDTLSRSLATSQAQYEGGIQVGDLLVSTAQRLSSIAVNLARSVGNTFVELSRKSVDAIYEFASDVSSWNEFNIVSEAYAHELDRTDLGLSLRTALSEGDDLVKQLGQTVVLRQGRSPNPFISPDFNPDASPISLGSLSEGSVRTFTLYLPYDAGNGGQRVKLTLAGDAADKLTVLEDADEVALGSDGTFTLVVAEGRRELSFGLWAKEDIDTAATLELSAQLVDAEDVATHFGHIELALALDGADETPPVTSREIRGDWEAQPWTDPATGITYDYKIDDLGNVERQSGVPATTGWELDGWFDGSSGPDHIVTGDFNDSATGWAGDDVIVGSDQRGNLFYAGEGNDWIEGGADPYHAADPYLVVEDLGREMRLGDDLIYGGAGDDQIWGERAATQAALDDPGAMPTGLAGDWISGGSGADRIYGGAGDDVLLGGIGEDLLVGGAGMDVLLGDDDFFLRNAEGFYWTVVHPSFGDPTPGFGGFEVGLFPVINPTLAYPDQIAPQLGDPSFTYYKNGGGADVLVGGAGDDILIGEYGDDTLYGGEGDDILAGWEGDDELVGGDGNDMMAGDFGRYEQTNQRPVADAMLVRAGSLGPPGTYGSAVEQAGNDLLDGGAGDDVLYGEGGDDSLIGGDGDDTLYGDAAYLPEELHGDDILDGGDGNDTLYGGAGDDSLYGGAGDDALLGGPGSDLLEGDGGDDSLNGEQGDDTLRAGDGNDSLYGGDGSDELRAGAGDDALFGGDGDDALYGESGADALDGGAGDDRLYGGAGGDTIDGGDGDDLIDGGEGSDVLRGGAGDDSYVLGFGYGADLIEDDEGVNRIRFASGILPEDLRAGLDSDTVQATLAYTPLGDSVSIDMSGFELGGIDFADGSAWTRKQFVDLLPALVAQGSSDSEALEGNPNLRNAIHAGAGDDTLTGSGWDDLLEGGDGKDSADGGGGSDIYYYTGNEVGIDRIQDSGIDAGAYLDAYYAALGIADWRERGAHGGEYHVVQQVEGFGFDVYYGSYEEALAENPAAAIDFIEPLPALAPVVQRDDDAALDELFAAGTLARDVVRFGPGVALADLSFSVAVPAASADAFPEQPWHDGGTLSVRWGAGGFDLAVPDASYGFAGPSLPANPDDYRLGEGIEAFEFDDGSRYTLEQALKLASVVPLLGEYHIARDSGPQLITAAYEAIVFDVGIRASEVAISRDGADLLLTLNNGPTQARVQGWYGANGVTPPTRAIFYFDDELDAATLTETGLALHGTDGDDVLVGLDGYSNKLYGEWGDDVLEGGSGDDLLQGGYGADAFVLEAGGGHDVVENPYYWIQPSSEDRIQVADDLAPQDISITRNTNDLSVWVLDSTTQLEIQDWFWGDATRLGGIEFADGTFWDADRMEAEARYVPEPGTAQDDVINGGDGDDVIDALGGDDEVAGGFGDDVIDGGPGDDYLEGGPGHDVLLGGEGADDVEDLEDGSYIDAGEGDDYTYDEGNAFVIGGPGDDWIDHYGDGGVIAFNPGDGDDTIYAAGAMTLSIGGGVQPGDLSLAHDGADLLLDVAGAGSIRLTRQWEEDPAAWPEITLQLFGSVHLYDFNAAIDAPGQFGDALEANKISSSETDGIGGALAWQYAVAGTTAGLSSTQMNSVLADPGFGFAPQPIVLAQPNRPPQLAAPIGNRSALEDDPFGLSLVGVFSDPDAGDSLAYGAALSDGSPLPAWLAFDAATASFAGTPLNDDVGALEITVVATDAEGESASDTFELDVLNVNDAPYLVAPLGDQTGQEGEALAFSVAGAFADVDAGDVLAYAATLADGTALPAWLSFDPASQGFAAAPGFADGGSYALRVSATDGAGASAAAEFSLEILESAPPVEPGGHEHHGHEHERQHGHDEHRHRHDNGKRDDRRDHDDPLHGRLATPPHYDFEALLRELDRHKPHESLSPAEIRAGWERVARSIATLGASEEDLALGAGPRDLLRLASADGRGFGVDGSVGAAARHDGFTSFEGLREGFRRL